MRAFRSIVFLFLSATLPLSAAELLNGVAVIVNDNIITYQDVQQFLEFEIDGLERRYGTSPRLFQEKVAEKQKEALEQLVERELILHEFKKAGYVLPESVIDNLINEEIREKFGDRATLTRTLQAQGKGFESWKEDLRNRIIVSEMRRMNVNSEIIISPHKIENYYVYHRDRFKLNDQVRLRMINLSQSTASAGKAKELGMQILQKIKEGSSFSEMASIYSEGPQKSQGGDYGWVEKNVLVKPLNDAAFALDAKQVSDVIGINRESNGDIQAYRFGMDGKLLSHQTFSKDGNVTQHSVSESADPALTEVYLLYVEEKREAFVKSLAEVRDEIEMSLRSEETERIRKRWIERLRKKSYVRYF